jgi:hypothetical protein
MKNKILLLLICLFEISCHAYSQKSVFGTYSANNFINRFSFSILDLKSDSTFWYCDDFSRTAGVGVDNIYGCWKIKDNFLILNSTNPKRITVWENYSKKSKYSRIYIEPTHLSQNTNFRYNLYIVTGTNDTLFYLKKTEKKFSIKKNIKSFWIEDVDSGIKSLPYSLLSNKTNILFVSFYRGIVFEDVKWLIVDENKIRANEKLLIRKNNNPCSEW